MRIFISSIVVRFYEMRGVHTRDNFHAWIRVDRDGHISALNKTTLESIDELVELGYARWRAIGPEDREIFATERLMELIAPAFNALPESYIKVEEDSL